MIITADWVLPIFVAPIRNGAVRIHNGRIAECGPAETLLAANPDVQRHDFEGCAILPGLVNAHTHLALTCLKGLIPPQPFADWIKRIPTAVRALNNDDLAASIAHGASQSILSGVTVVGDVAHGPESVAIAADLGLGGSFYWEVLGIPARQLGARLEAMEFPSQKRQCSARLSCGLSPHAPYTSGPDLLRLAHALAKQRDLGFAIHLAESDAEVDLVRDGTGPLGALAARLADGFEPTGSNPIGYLDGLGVLDGAVAVHCTKALPVDMPALSDRARGVVVCPRSNAYLKNGEPPVERMKRAGVLLGLGTDSLGSNENLDLFDEARALATVAPNLQARDIIEVMTEGGAAVLGMEETFGSFRTGRQADLSIFLLPEGFSEDPYDALLSSAGRRSLRAVLSAGIWRVLHGQPTFPTSFVERGAQLAAAKVALALDAGPA